MKPQQTNHDMPVSPLETVNIGGIDVAAASMQELAEQMLKDCQARRAGQRATPRLVFDINGQGLSLSETDPTYSKALKRADIIHADGEFIVKLSKWRRGISIPERSATTDFIWVATEAAARHNLSFYLLGGEPGLAEQTRDKLQQRYPALNVIGCHHGFFKESEEPDLIKEINDLKPDILWVGLGKPREQIFSTKNKEALSAGWLVTCGGCFNFVTGDYKRAPEWMQNAGLEWLHRMATRPRSLFWRYAVTTPHSLYLALTR